ncbi:MAG: FHA domain-containing protein [Pseudomonadales bacterium]
MDAHERSHLTLDWHDRRVVHGAATSLSLGARAGADLTVSRAFASRDHAHIEKRKQFYVLIDHSTNGTFVQTEDERVVFVRRGEVRLWGRGWLSLGEPLSPESAIRFQQD